MVTVVVMVLIVISIVLIVIVISPAFPVIVAGSFPYRVTAGVDVRYIILQPGMIFVECSTVLVIFLFVGGAGFILVNGLVIRIICSCSRYC